MINCPGCGIAVSIWERDLFTGCCRRCQTAGRQTGNCAMPPPTGARGGLLPGAIAGVFLVGMVGFIGFSLERPKDTINILSFFGWLLGCGVIGGFTGMIWGAVIAWVNARATQPVQSGLMTGSILGVIAGLVVTGILFWNSDPLTLKLAGVRAHFIFALTSMGLIIGLSLGGVIGLAIRSPVSLFQRVRLAVIGGTIAGFLAGLCVNGIWHQLLIPALKRYVESMPYVPGQ